MLMIARDGELIIDVKLFHLLTALVEWYILRKKWQRSFSDIEFTFGIPQTFFLL
jgi:hypothetical protein